nr:MAG TPA: hypothetical protein [Caudoviricetes sp.]
MFSLCHFYSPVNGLVAILWQNCELALHQLNSADLAVKRLAFVQYLAAFS